MPRRTGRPSMRGCREAAQDHQPVGLEDGVSDEVVHLGEEPLLAEDGLLPRGQPEAPHRALVQPSEVEVADDFHCVFEPFDPNS